MVRSDDKNINLVSRVLIGDLKNNVEAKSTEKNFKGKLKNATRLISIANRMSSSQNQNKLSVLDLTKSVLNTGGLLNDIIQEKKGTSSSIFPLQNNLPSQPLSQSILHPISQFLNTINASEISSILPVPQAPSLETIEASLLLNPLHKETRKKDLSILPSIQEEEQSLASSQTKKGQEIRRERLKEDEGMMKLENFSLSKKRSTKIDVPENLDFFQTKVIDRSIHSAKKQLMSDDIKQLENAESEIKGLELIGGLSNLIEVFSENHGWIFMQRNTDRVTLERIELSSDGNPYFETVLSKLRQKSYDQDDFSVIVAQVASLIRVRERISIKIAISASNPKEATITKEKNLQNCTILSKIVIDTPKKGGIDLSNKGLQKFYQNTENVSNEGRTDSKVLSDLLRTNKIAEFFFLLYKTQKNGALNIFQMQEFTNSSTLKINKFEVVSNLNQDAVKTTGMFKIAVLREQLELLIDSSLAQLEAKRSIFENLNRVQEKLRLVLLRPSEKKKVQEKQAAKSEKDGSQKLRSSILKNIISQKLGSQIGQNQDLGSSQKRNTSGSDLSSHPLLANLDNLCVMTLNAKERDALRILLSNTEASSEGTKEFFLKS